MKNTLNIGIIKLINNEVFISFKNSLISVCAAQQSMICEDIEGETVRFQLTKSNRAILYSDSIGFV